jgi:hypothetical protein
VGKKSVPVDGKDELAKIQLKKVKQEDSDAGSGTVSPSGSRRGTIDAQFMQRRESTRPGEAGGRRDSIVSALCITSHRRRQFSPAILACLSVRRLRMRLRVVLLMMPSRCTAAHQLTLEVVE